MRGRRFYFHASVKVLRFYYKSLSSEIDIHIITELSLSITSMINSEFNFDLYNQRLKYDDG